MDPVLHLSRRPLDSGLLAWQFRGQPFHQWPSWVQGCCSLQRGVEGRVELRHDRRSGAQIVYLDEWLVRDLDGGISFYTDAEMRRDFMPAR
ncbi:hypothetical protein [Rhodopseudomonas palustris]|uniref:Uncharacterized protein n=1 Tax=Rhodopseudomonas palustris TaxID=1076 RepID=A0A418UX16_RHOPL|nr:hypothetical protein [Rhodopseudomonas palustris]RJF64232.1 hypothetical protein D4Q52_25450 [Rhodopseudomonas palustris]